MTDRADPTPKDPSPPRKRRGLRALRRAIILTFDVMVVVLLVVFLAGLTLSGQSLPLPDKVTARAEAQLSDQLGAGSARLGGTFVEIDQRGLPRVAFSELQIFGPGGAEILMIPRLGVSLDKTALLAGEIRPRRLRLDRASVRVHRDIAGDFNLAFGQSETALQVESIAQALGTLNTVFGLPVLADLDEVRAEDVIVTFDDARAGRSWTVDNGTALLTQEGATLGLFLALPLVDEDETDETGAARVAVRILADQVAGEARIAVQASEVPATDLASQIDGVSWLKGLDATIHGSVIAVVGAADGLTGLNGTLRVDPGEFRTAAVADPVPIESVQSYFRLDPEGQRLIVDDISIAAGPIRLRGAGHAFPDEIDEGVIESAIAQLTFSEVEMGASPLFVEGASFDGGAADLRLDRSEGAIDIGQFVLSRSEEHESDLPGTDLLASGRLRLSEEGWTGSLQMTVDEIAPETLVALWPATAAPKTRTWARNRISGGTIRNVTGVLGLQPGQRPLLIATYQFEGSQIHPVDSLPPITAASGYASIDGQSFIVSLDEGTVTPPEGGDIAMKGTSFRILDVRRKQGPAELAWQSESSVTALLSLLDLPPFEFMTKAGQPVDHFEGRAEAEGILRFDLKPRLRGKDFDYSFEGRVLEASSETLVPGRLLEADALLVRADPKEVSVSGPATLNGVPLRATWALGLEPGSGPSTVEGTVEISQATVDAFNIGLPDGTVTGSGFGQFRIELPQGEAPVFTLVSDLNRVGLRIAELAWSKPPARLGSLRVEGRFSSPPVLDTLSLDAGGLVAEGSVELTPGGGLEAARFDRVSVGGWIDAPVTLQGRGRGRSPQVIVRGGTVDIRKTSFGQGGGSGGAGSPISLTLDRLVISEGITLTDMQAQLSQIDGLAGQFSGRVNGAAPVSGSLVPGRGGGTEVRMTASDAGNLFRAAGLFGKGQGGTMSLTLLPRSEPGQYDGTLKVENVRVQSAPGLAALLNAISIVGLIDQLNGPGLLFTDVDASFRLTPNAVQVDQSYAVGPSLGISMTGLYDMVRDEMDMEGVFSPVYFVNAVGQIVSRQGEGLIGLTYRMRGPPAAPQVAVNPLSALTPGFLREIFRGRTRTLPSEDTN